MLDQISKTLNLERKRKNYRSKWLYCRKLIISFKTIYFQLQINRDKQKMFKALINRSIVSEHIMSEKSGLSFIDEGIYQLIYYSIGSRIDPKIINNVVSKVSKMTYYKPNIVVQLSASPETIVERRAKRNRHNEKSINKKDVIKEQKRFKEYTEHFRKIARMNNINFLELDISTKDNFKRAKKSIINEILNYL